MLEKQLEKNWIWKNKEVKKCQKEEKLETLSYRGKETAMGDMWVIAAVWYTINGCTMKFMK